MLNKISSLLILMLTFGQLSAFAQFEETFSEIEWAINRMHLDQADALLEDVFDDPTRKYYQSHIAFIRVAATDDPKWSKAFFSKCNSALKTIDKLPEEDVRKKAWLGEIRFMRGMISLMNKKYFDAFGDLKKACKLIEEHADTYPGDFRHELLFGVFQVSLSAVPKKFQWISNVLCMKGNLDHGMKLLAKVANEGSALHQQEAQLLLFFFEKNLLDSPDLAEKRVRSLRTADEDIFIIDYLTALALIKNKKNDQALEILEKYGMYDQDEAIFFSPFWYHDLGKAYSHRLDFEKGIELLETFLEAYNGSNNTADAIWRMGIFYEMIGEREKAKESFSRILNGEDEFGMDEDSYAYASAKKFMTNPMSESEKMLFQARFLFDGGYFNQGPRVLDSLDQSGLELHPDEALEMNYRYGRIFHALREYDQAKRYYLSSIKMKGEAGEWMRIYSMYYLGNIQEEEGNYPQAERLYQQALTHDGYFYQSGLEQVCKAALARLDSK